MNFDIKYFDIKRIKFNPNASEGPVIVMIGKRGTGKSVLVKDLLYHHQDLKLGMIMSGTEQGNGFYSTLAPRVFIHYEYNTSLIETIIQRQKKVLKYIKNELKTKRRSNTDGRVFIILDDCLYDQAWTRDKLMRMLFMNGRHWKIMLMITMQYPLGVPPNLRTNIDYTFILRESNLANRKRIWINYAGMCPTFEFFCTIMDQCTENYECLVIANNAKSNKLEDQIFWYKAKMHKDFKIGARQYWEMSKDYDSDEETGTEYDPNNISKGTQINVRKGRLF